VAERTRRTRELAEQTAEDIVAELSTITAGFHTHEPIRNLVEFYRGDWANKRQWAATTRQERDRGIARLPDWFLDLPCGAWRVSHSERVLADVAASGWPFGSAEYHRVGSTLSGMVTAGIAGDYLPHDTQGRGPMKDVRYQVSSAKRAKTDDERKDPLKHLKPIDPEEIPTTDAVYDFASVADRMFGERWGTHALLMAFAGPRIGESLAFQEPDVLLLDESMALDIRKQIQQVRKRYSPDGTGVLIDVPPKYDLQRTAWVSPHLHEKVLAARAESLMLGNSNRIFSKTGAPMTPDRYRSEIFDPVARKLDWERTATGRLHKSGTEIYEWKWNVHSFRHHAATWMLRTLRMNPVNVSITLGHSNSLTTERLYLSRTGRDFRALDRAVETWSSTHADSCQRVASQDHLFR
jgi:integrase